ncbi:hypothetical protein [Streptomyces exfoliatus]|uniref:hypothetical protein n=1 Tax=Streptomyces exfoliatus TaxID=1905 RepID=UPI00324A3D19
MFRAQAVGAAPALLIVAVTWVSAWRQGRLAVDEFAEFAELVEAAVDPYGLDLANALGVPWEGRITAAESMEITRVLRKGT